MLDYLPVFLCALLALAFVHSAVSYSLFQATVVHTRFFFFFFYGFHLFTHNFITFDSNNLRIVENLHT